MTENGTDEKERNPFEDLPLPCLCLNEVGCLIEANGEWLSIMGYCREDVLGKPLKDYLHPESVGHFPALAAEGELRGLGLKMMRKNGTALSVSLDGKTTKRGEGRLLTYCIIKIEAREKEPEKGNQFILEDSLSEEKEALIECCKVVLNGEGFRETARAIFDIAKRVTGARSGYVALLDEEGAENEVLFLDSGGLACSVDPTLPMPIRGLRSEAYKLGRVVYENHFPSSEWARLMPEGHVRLENVLFAPLVIEAKPRGLLGLANKHGGFTPNDARICASFGEFSAMALKGSMNLEKLHEREEMYRSLFENSRDGILLSIPAEGRIISANPEACKIFGCTEDEILRLKYTSLLKGRDPGQRSILDVLISEESPRGEVVFIRKDGSRMTCDVSSRQVQGKGGKEIVAWAVRDVTQRIKGEEALRESERRFRMIAENTADMVSQHEPDGRILYVSPSAERLLGYSVQELTGSTLEIVTPPDALETAWGAVKEAIAKGFDHYRTQHPMIRKNGKAIWVETNGSLLYDEAGHLKRIQCQVRDITEQKLAQDALRSSEMLNRTILQTAMDGFCLVDLQGRLMEANDAYCKMSGYSRQELLGLSISDLEAAETDEQVAAHIRAIAQGGDRFESKHHRKDGSTFDVEVSVKYEPGAGIFAFLRNITDRKKADEELRASEERYRQLFELESDALFLIDNEKGDLLEANLAAERLYGYSKKELLGMQNVDLSAEPEDTARATRQEVPRVPVRFHRKKDGTVFPVEITAAHFVHQGRPAHIAAIRDITEPKRSEEKNERLQARLLQAQKMEAIGTLAGGIAHDFNNILGVILGCTEITMLEMKRGSQFWENLNEAYRAAERAKELVKQILTFSRQAPQEKKAIRVDLVLKEALKFLRSSLPSTIEIKQRIENAGHVMGDLTQIHQVIMNLFVNAGYAMREKGGVLTVEVNGIDLNPKEAVRFGGLKSGAYCRLEVSDTGHGMGPAIINRIFDPYFTTKGPEGTGLGLAVVHGVVKAHGGAIVVESEPGKGTVFEVVLPRIDNTSDNRFVPEAELPPFGKGERILVVDDEPGLAHMYKEMLEGLGYEAEARTSSIAGLEAFSSNPDDYSLIFTDLTMPEITGFELSKRILSIRPHMPIVLCTGYNEGIDQEKALAHGIRRLLVKPIARKELAEMILLALKN